MVYNITGGGSGGAGATLTVTAPAGVTVTASKDGKTKTKIAGPEGLAVFRGLASGEWTISITDGEQTAQKTVTITADYSTAITFFSATIHVTYPAGSTCKATNGATTLTAPGTSGTWDCVVPNAGTWILDIDDCGFSEKVTINTNGETKYVTKWHLFYDGDEYVSITGGWEHSSDNGGSFENDGENLHSTISSGKIGIYTKKKVPISKFSTVNTRTTLSSAVSADLYINNIGTCYADGANSPTGYVVYCGKSISTGDDKVTKIDVSGVTTDAIVNFFTYHCTSVYVHEVWLEV